MHPATKQLDGRMQIQALPSSLTVVPVFMASGHTTKTSAMPSSSTLHYAAKQLDDTLINSRTQPFTRQLNTSPPAKQLDEISWFKSWQLTPLNNHCSAATATCQHMQVDTYELLQTDRHAAGRPQGNFQTPKMNARTRVSPERRSPLTLICNADHTLQHNFGKEWPKTFSAARHCEDASSSSAETTTLRLEIPTEQQVTLVQDDPATKVN